MRRSEDHFSGLFHIGRSRGLVTSKLDSPQSSPIFRASSYVDRKNSMVTLPKQLHVSATAESNSERELPQISVPGMRAASSDWLGAHLSYLQVARPLPPAQGISNVSNKSAD